LISFNAGSRHDLDDYIDSIMQLQGEFSPLDTGSHQPPALSNRVESLLLLFSVFVCNFMLNKTDSKPHCQGVKALNNKVNCIFSVRQYEIRPP